MRFKKELQAALLVNLALVAIASPALHKMQVKRILLQWLLHLNMIK